jgi:Protein of unknown function (DUF3489)
MTKPKSKPKAATRSIARKTGKSRAQSAHVLSKPATGPSTKHARIIAMLRTPAGTTIASLVSATEWQQHSVRGFLSGGRNERADSKRDLDSRNVSYGIFFDPGKHRAR